MVYSGDLSRRAFLKLGGVGLTGVVFAGSFGCGGSGGETGRVVFSFGPEQTGTLRQLVDDFNEQQGGEIEVEWREMPADSSQYFDQLRTEFQAGGGDIDVIGGDVIWPAQFAANGWILNLSDRLPESARADYLDSCVEAVTYEGGVYGMPWYINAGMLYYRQDLLEEAGFSGPPETWEELKEMALKVREDAGVGNGFVFQGSEYEGGVVNGLEYIWTHGGEVLDGERVLVDSPEATAGLATARSMIESGVSPLAVTNYTETESHGIFLRGDAVFIRNWPYMYALLSNPDESRIEPGQVGVAPIPVGEGQSQSYSGLGGWNLLVNAASQMQDEAWEFIRFMTNHESQKFRAVEATILPTRKELYEDREVLEEVPVIAQGDEALQNARPRPVSPFYGDMSLAMAEKFSQSLRGDVPPEEAVGLLQADLEEIIARGGG
jgi:multiple sugar transport system substrate-binding protein